MPVPFAGFGAETGRLDSRLLAGSSILGLPDVKKRLKTRDGRREGVEFLSKGALAGPIEDLPNPDPRRPNQVYGKLSQLCEAPASPPSPDELSEEPFLVRVSPTWNCHAPWYLQSAVV